MSLKKAGTEVQGKLSPTLTSPSSCVTESNVADEEDEDEPGTESGDENNALDEVETVGSAKVTSSVTRVTDKISDDNEDDDWDTFKMQSKKANSLNAAKKESHSVHCPYFPGVSMFPKPHSLSIFPRGEHVSQTTLIVHISQG